MVNRSKYKRVYGENNLLSALVFLPEATAVARLFCNLPARL